jgi:hypothetical protein
MPIDSGSPFAFAIPEAPILEKSRYADISSALRAGPATFVELMSAAGSRDGRDVMRAIEALDVQGLLVREEDGRYSVLS